ncbi:MAG: hypothetical protein EOM91_16850 [Sphingobacteriia bacterium]|nr:hypothetical protein [Sphingobacteriia bacterium]
MSARVVADRAYFAPYLEWADALIAWSAALAAETAQTGEQSMERWRLLIGLYAAGANAFWALAVAAPTQREQANLGRSALAQERTREALVAALDPQILVRQPGDLSPLLQQYGSLARKELLTQRAREDVAYLSRQVGEIDPVLADAMLRRIPAGVLAWA